MPTNSLTASGLTIQQQPDIVAALANGINGVPGYTSIYGSDINLGPQTPDGQQINIYATVLEDNLELLQSVYNMFTLPNAYGVQLDNLGSLLNVLRQQGTFTQAQVVVTAGQAVTILGQDALSGNPNATVFTVSDQNGNQFQLLQTHAFAGAGTATLTFVATTLGQIQTSPNTITTILTPITGISSVNNPSIASDVIGANEESDSAYRIRMAKSLQMGATGPADSLQAQLANIPGCLDAYVAENDTASPVSGVPANGIWVIVNPGTATPAQIAQTIYAKKSMGCAQKTTSGQSFSVPRPQGGAFTAYWDLALTEDLHISFTILPINGQDTFDPTTLAQKLAAALSYKLGQTAFVGQIVAAMQQIAPNGYIIDTFVGNGPGPALQDIQPSDFQHYFVVIPTNITIST